VNLAFTGIDGESPPLPLARAANVLWSPNPGPQTDLVTCPVFEVFYGGARGGGKTEGSIGDWLLHAEAYGENASGVFFRRTLIQLDDVIKRTKRYFSKVGAKYSEQKKEWTFPNGARLKFRYIERDSDAEQYQGHEYTRVYVEEVTNFPTPVPIMLLLGTVRSSSGVPCGIRLTGNPGGPGHNWVKKRYIDPAPAGYTILKEKAPIPEAFGGSDVELERVFIPSQLRDNPQLMKNDPMYVGRLASTGSAQLVRAWLTGDWTIALGAYFTQFDQRKHVLPVSMAKYIPPWCTRFVAFDWGYAKPFSVGWYAVSDGTFGLPRGALIKYREWYGSTGRANEGLKLTAAEVATGIRIREANDPTMSYRVADPAIFIKDGGPSIGETMAIHDVMFRRADNRRLSGWNQVRQQLVGANGVPNFYVLDCCVDTIRTLEAVPADSDNPDDVDTDSEDHAADETRYAVMSRFSTSDSQAATRENRPITMDDLWRQNDDRREPDERI
jgi:hypothetical protein